jgi:biotin carboxyl carrier protein
MSTAEAVSLRQEHLQEAMDDSGGFGFRLVVAPVAGRIRHLPPAQFHEGDEWVTAGQPLAVVERGNLSVEVISPAEARVAGVLVRDGEPVLKGQPVVWLDESPRRSGAGR